MSGRDLLAEYQHSTRTTQTQLSKRLNVTSAYVSLLLSGDRIPGLGMAYRIERVTGGAVPSSSWLSDIAKRDAAKRRTVSRRARQAPRQVSNRS